MGGALHLVVFLRRSMRRHYGFAAALLGVCLLLGGMFEPSVRGPGPWWTVALLAGSLGLMVVRFRARQRAKPPQGRALFDLELGALGLVLTHALLRSAGGLASTVVPVVYVFVAACAAFLDRRAGIGTVVLAVLLEAGLYVFVDSSSGPTSLASRAGFVALFGVLNLLFMRVQMASLRTRSERELSLARERLREDARLFRLVAAPTDSGGADDERLFQSSVEEVHQALYHTLDLLRRTLDLHTCALLMRDDGDQCMRLAELVSTSDEIAEGPFRMGEGVVGAVMTRGTAMGLEKLRPSYRGICFYRGENPVRSFLGVPVVEKDIVRGVLCADRVPEDRPFLPRDEEILKGAARQLLRSLQNEQVFVQLERSKREQAVLHRASQALGAARTEDETMNTALEAATEIAPYDFAAITTYDARRHSVRRAVGEDADKFNGLGFRDNASLTAMVVKNRHYLPYRGEFDADKQTAFTRKANLRKMQSLLIMPLIVRETAIGTFAIAARREHAFGESVRRTQQVLANQLAVAMANAASVRRLEELATTDGLTGCLNKRAFLEELERKIASAHRFRRKLSLLVTDLDHFKFVNDTYGHATGDLILEGLGEILRRAKRETDVVARFGGEEFCVLCEETDTEGAVLLAERVRQEIGAREFHTDHGKLTVTCSLGVATFPDDAKSARELFEAADRGLYVAKGSGRNMVCTAKAPGLAGASLKLRSKPGPVVEPGERIGSRPGGSG